MEDRKGMLKLGYFFDIVVLIGDIVVVVLEVVFDLKVVVIICDGWIIYLVV